MDKTVPSGEITRLLGNAGAGDADAENRLMELLYTELRKMARRQLRNERPEHTLETSDLVHQAYLRLVDGKVRNWQNRAHFFAITAHTMRQILVDHARSRQAQKRGGKDLKVSIDSVGEMSLDFSAAFREQDYPKLLMLDEALSKLETLDPQQARVVELRFFVGLTEEEAAEGMGISVQTVKREWKAARSWLYREMTR